ncbi:hypothetical protein PR048_002137 [Dryococelus australis]|uniref:Uncharacterized protein n=1 Tax=Dryococelus australis TaxID=614101 RepID=A0ABQ9IJB1_9NEOP|nr:hypothetical protein PR048_002137 [Dryococelus australis]
MSFFRKQNEAHHAGVKHANTDNENATEASFLLSYSIARAGKPHTIAEDHIEPCVAEIIGCMLIEDTVKTVSAVQYSDNTVPNRIHKITDYIEDELIKRLKNCNAFSLQLDESTDVAGLTVLIVIVRYVFEESIEEDLILCTP